jgi:hypothetical protein
MKTTSILVGKWHCVKSGTYLSKITYFELFWTAVIKGFILWHHKESSGVMRASSSWIFGGITSQLLFQRDFRAV